MTCLSVGKLRISKSIRTSKVSQFQRTTGNGLPLNISSLRTTHLFMIVTFHSMRSFPEEMIKLDGGFTLHLKTKSGKISVRIHAISSDLSAGKLSTGVRHMGHGTARDAPTRLRSV